MFKAIEACHEAVHAIGCVSAAQAANAHPDRRSRPRPSSIRLIHTTHASLKPRIATDIRVGSRMDKVGTLENKVSSVEQLLA